MMQSYIYQECKSTIKDGFYTNKIKERRKLIMKNNSGIELIVNGEKVFLSNEVIAELHKQENIEWGKDIVANYVSDEKLAAMTEKEFKDIAIRLEELNRDDNGDREIQAIEEIIGSIDDDE